MIAWSILIGALLLAYFYVKLFGNLGKIWQAKINKDVVPSDFSTTVSVLIAFRNEENNLTRLVERLVALSFPKNQLECIFIDDHSEDNSKGLLQELLRNTDLNAVILSNEGKGKKAALKTGTAMAQHEVLLFTDADVSVRTHWVEAMLQPLKGEVRMVCGPVMFDNNIGFSEKWKQLEFVGLMSSGASFIAAKKPVMANGANLAILRKQYKVLMQSVKGEDLASGDDVFLLHAQQAINPNAIAFAFQQEAIVYTSSPKGIKAFISQRLRWAAKAKHYTNPTSIFLSVFVFVFHLALLVSFALCFYKYLFIPPFLVLLFAKYYSDVRFFKRCLPFYNLKQVHYNYAYSVHLHALYIVGIGLLSLFVRVTWKGRKI